MIDIIYKKIVNSLSAHVALLSADGAILDSNRAWRCYAEDNGLSTRADTIGVNYLVICDQAAANGDEDAALVAGGIRQVLGGSLTEFTLPYPCHSPTRQQWFNMRALPCHDAGEVRCIVVHEDITPIVLVQEQLRRQERELEEKSGKLEEANIALRVLLEHRNRAMEELRESIAGNIRELVLPYIARLQQALVGQRALQLADIASRHLQDIASPFLQQLTSREQVLTPQEMEVAALVRQGKSSQEIADIMNLATSTVSFHRGNLRRKLGLEGRRANLRSLLLTMHNT